jgi:hypothetical protein
MLRQLVAALAACLLLSMAGQGTAFAQAEDATLLEPMRAFAGMIGGELAGDWKSGENIVTFSRSAEGALRTTGRPVPTAPGEWAEPEKGTVALMRTRPSSPDDISVPAAADLDFVGRTGIPVFIVGLWSTPPMMWQIARQDGRVQWREVDVDAKPGPWRMLAPVAVSP